ncbi:GH1 family beta-glucosidase [Egicoccus sp. AB-alg6-2]|uniref:GH1 family beta-glucosidase n=1 Tax=Egicoccus sp. AB-alg6-2 TaxID=3242692 RepID=UPI00359E1382
MTIEAAALPPAIYGVATSSYQIEGATDVDGRGDSIWDTFGRVPGNVVGGDTGETGCDHYHRLSEDLDLLAWLGVDSYRFSIAWPRVLPDGERVESRGLAFYDRLVDGLLDRGIRPLATLYHWDLPQALETAGGWASRETVERFATYARVVAEHLGDRVGDWSTLNEPWCSAFLGYDVGVHAPGVRDPARAIAATHHLLLAHGRGTRVLRDVLGPDASIGLVINPAPVRPASDAAEDVEVVALADGMRNRVWTDPVFRGVYPDDVLAAWEPLADLAALHRDGDLDEIAAPVDVLGINYYTPLYVGARAAGHEGASPAGPGQDHVVELSGPPPASAMGWSIDPTGLYDLLTRLDADYDVPMAITETGGAFPDAPDEDGRVDDTDRIAYLDGHLEEFARAARDGVDLRAFYVWTLLDNFEWAEGYRRTFGIVRVDRDTMRRIPKRSAYWYRDLLAARTVRPTG